MVSDVDIQDSEHTEENDSDETSSQNSSTIDDSSSEYNPESDVFHKPGCVFKER